MNELPRGLKWSDAPEWANVLIDGWGEDSERPDDEEDVSRYSWASSNEVEAWRKYAQGGMILARVERSHLYKLVAVRPGH